MGLPARQWERLVQPQPSGHSYLSTNSCTPLPYEEQHKTAQWAGRTRRAKGVRGPHHLPWQGLCPTSGEATGWRSTSTLTSPGFYPLCPDSCLPLKQNCGTASKGQEYIHCMNTFPSKVTFRWLGVEEACLHLGWGPACVTNTSSLPASPGPWKMLQATRAKTMPLTASLTQFTSLCYKLWFFSIVHRDFQDELRLTCAIWMRQAVKINYKQPEKKPNQTL